MRKKDMTVSEKLALQSKMKKTIESQSPEKV